MKMFLPSLITLLVISLAAHAQQMQNFDIEIGKPLKLLPLGGPNVDLIVNSVDQFDIAVTIVDHDNKKLVVSGNYYSVSGEEQPTVSREQIKKSDSGITRIFLRGNVSAYHVAAMETGQNQARIAVKIDP